MSKFTVVRPLDVTDAMIVSHNVVDEAIAAWTAGDYTVGQQRIHAKSIWECKQDGTSTTAPKTGDPLWMRVRSVNHRAALDRRKLTATKQAYNIAYVFRPGQVISAFAAINLVECTQITVQLVDPDYGVVYDKTNIVGDLPIASDWHAFLLLPWEEGDDSQGFFLDLPGYPNAELHVEFVGTAGLAVGAMLFGMAREWGVGINWGLQLGGKDYSLKEADEYGETELVERFFADTVDCDPVVHLSEVTPLHRYLKSLRATPALYITVTDQAAANVYAKYNDFRIVMSNNKFAALSIQVEALL